jgi:Putative addiction module component
MEVHFAPELQAKIDQLVADSGCRVEALIEDAMEAYIADLAQAREMLDRRYDDLKSGKVKLIPGDEVEAYFREKIAARRKLPVHDRV